MSLVLVGKPLTDEEMKKNDDFLDKKQKVENAKKLLKQDQENSQQSSNLNSNNVDPTYFENNKNNNNNENNRKKKELPEIPKKIKKKEKPIFQFCLLCYLKKGKMFWREFSFPIKAEDVEIWCNLSEIWFYEIEDLHYQHSIEKNKNQKPFIFNQNKQFFVNDKERLFQRDLNSGGCYFVCGYGNEESDDEYKQIREYQKKYQKEKLEQKNKIKKKKENTVKNTVINTQLLISNFCTITGTNDNTGQFYCSMSENNLENALSQYFSLTEKRYQNNYNSSTNLLDSPYQSTFNKSVLDYKIVSRQLFHAIQHDKFGKLLLLLELPFIKKDVVDEKNRNCLHFGGINGSQQIAQILLNDESIVKLIDKKESEFGYTPLHYACYFSQSKSFINTFLEKGADLTIKDKNGFTPIQYTIIGGKPLTFTAIIDFLKKKNISLSSLIDIKNDLFNDGNTILHKAIETHSLKIVESIINLKGAENICNKKNDFGITPLVFACNEYKQCDEIVELLLSKFGTLLNIDEPCQKPKNDNNNNSYYRSDIYGLTPIQIAFEKENHKIVAILLKYGSNPNIRSKKSGNTIFHDIIGSYREDQVLEIIKNNPHIDLNLKGVRSRGISPIQLAATKQWPKVIDLLIKKNVEVNIFSESELERSGISFTPLSNACVENSIFCIEPLLQSKQIDINLQSKIFKRAPLHFAGMRGHKRIISVLCQESKKVNKKLNVNIQDVFGFTPLHYAKIFRNENSLNELIINGGDVTKKDIFGITIANFNCFYKTSMIKKKKDFDEDNAFRSYYRNKYHLSRKKNNRSYFITQKSYIKNSEEAERIYKRVSSLYKNLPYYLRNIHNIYGVSYFFCEQNIYYYPVNDYKNLSSDEWSSMKLFKKMDICLEVGYILTVLHSCGVLHNNLTRKSILYDYHNENILVSNYGLPFDNHGKENWYDHDWFAPEVRKNGYNGFSEKSDIFAYGALCISILTGEVYDPDVKIKTNDKKIQALLKTLSVCVEKNPSERPNSMKVLFKIIFPEITKIVKSLLYENQGEFIDPTVQDEQIKQMDFNQIENEIRKLNNFYYNCSHDRIADLHKQRFNLRKQNFLNYCEYLYSRVQRYSFYDKKEYEKVNFSTIGKVITKVKQNIETADPNNELIQKKEKKNY